MPPRPRKTRLLSSVARFARSEDGGATIWNLSWLLGFAIMAGVSIDSTNGWRNKTMLQSTADVSSLAGAIELPNPLREIPYDPTSGAYDGTVKAKALEYADKNQGLGADEYGAYLTNEDILIGNWDPDTRTFTPGDDFATPDEKPVNAVQVDLFQNETSRGNGVPMQVLGTIGWSHWEVSTEAIAIKGYHECYNQGFMAEQKVCQTSNSDWYPGFCIYGDNGINLNQGNRWGEGSEAILPVSAEGAEDGIKESNRENGLTVTDGPMDIPLINQIPEIAQDILSGSTFYTHPDFVPSSEQLVKLGVTDLSGNADPAEVEQTIAGGGGTGGSNPSGQQGSSSGCQGGSSGGNQLDPLPAGYNPLKDVAAGNMPDDANPWTNPVLEKDRIYYYDGTDTIKIDGNLEEVVIVSHGNFSIESDSSLENVTLVSLQDKSGGNDSVQFKGVRIGNVDPCDPGGEVAIYTMGSIGGSGKTSFYGVTMAAAGSIGFAAQADAMFGIAAYSGGNVKFAANNSFGGMGSAGLTNSGACAEGTPIAIPDEFMRVRLVQ